ncbi:alanine racemase [Arenibaculum pallidiluteum]|uniref:alanine racemase n=1 Tax=Arenibaculum pallidiluteum TaxID=2812559 RepID=UPI001A95E85F|nr:alanine racemase [Arenibaculum pallidiluteum]
MGVRDAAVFSQWNGHPAGSTAWATVHLDRLRGNLAAIRRVLPHRTQVHAVVKADAYGHGSTRVAKELEGVGVDALAVSSTSEGIELRKVGIHCPILVLGPILPEEAAAAVGFDLAVTVSSSSLALALGAAAAAAGRRARAHVRVDLSLAGFGLPADQAVQFLGWLHSLGGIEVEGLYTHNAGAYRGDPAMMDAERAAVASLVEAVSASGLRPPLVHALSSPGVAIGGIDPLDAVRVGSLLYGIRMVPAAPPGIRPVMEIGARVLDVRAIPAGQATAYERGCETDRPRRVATVAMGFAQAGFLFHAEGGWVLVRGTRLPILGRPFMSTLLADASAVPDVSPGDVATLVGADGPHTITVEDVGAYSRVRPSAVPLLGQGVARVYRDCRPSAGRPLSHENAMLGKV